MRMDATVAILMGSKSDLDVVRPAFEILKKFGVKASLNIISAHRTPFESADFAQNAEKNGIKIIIGAAGKAAHLAGVIAAHTVLPVIALPVQTSFMGGLDSLLSMVQMPSGIPVATVGVNAGENAGLLAIQMLALSDEKLNQKLHDYKKQMADKINAENEKLQKELENTISS